jgi:tetratricopeptide (TPR) repeat protein
MKTQFILFALACNFFSCFAQNSLSNETAYKAYLGNKDVKVTKDLWKSFTSDMSAKANSIDNKNTRFELALAQFGLLSATMRDKDEDLFDEYIDDAEENLEVLIDDNKSWGDPKALLGAITGLKIAYMPIKGMFLGPKSQELLEKSIKESPKSPLAWKLYGNSKLQTPEAFGGDIKEAIKAYEKAITLFESDTTSLQFNWFYLDTLAYLGQAYTKDSQSSKAITVFEKALTVEPNFMWVKYTLLPNAKKQPTSAK